MTELFVRILNISLAASWLIAAVLLLRPLLKKAPKWIRVLLWGIVAVRLLLPFSIESTFSLIPSAEVINPTLTVEPLRIETGIPAFNNALNPLAQESVTTIAPEKSVNTATLLIFVFSRIWAAGAVLLLGYSLLSYWLLRRKVRTAVRLEKGIFQSEHVDSPFVLGFFKPRIYLPFQMPLENRSHVIAHEQAHIRRKDHLWKPLGFLLLAVHWLNPLMWLAYILFCRDIELACDEKVIRELGSDQRADYTQSLVACSVSRRSIAACPIAFGEVGVKERVKSVLHYKKPAFWIILLALLSCAVVAVCFLTNPVQNEPDLSFLYYQNASSVVASTGEVLSIYCPTSGGSIQIGKTSGTELAKQLEKWDWKECKPPRNSLPSPGSVEFVISQNYRITVHNRKSGSLRQYAVVQHGEETRYYRIDRSDYPDAVALVYSPTKEPAILHATILAIEEDHYLVKPYTGSRELIVGELLEVPFPNSDLSPKPRVGDMIEVFYGGEIVSSSSDSASSSHRIRGVREIRPLEYIYRDLTFMLTENSSIYYMDAVSQGIGCIKLYYHGNRDNAVTIEDPEHCNEILARLFRAGGKRGESSKGHSGVPYTLEIYVNGLDTPQTYYLWSKTQYSTSNIKDAEGYPLFFEANLTELFAYLEENYPTN